MSLSKTRHDWLNRVSDYHSGGVSEAERAAVEAHLATCQECQEALAMYRRLYSLLHSPLRLGPPSVNFEDQTTIINSPTTQPPEFRPKQRPPRSTRSRIFAGVAAVLAATLVVAGFVAVYASHSQQPAGNGTPTVAPQASATATTASSPTAAPTTSVQPGSFVCANPAGSILKYAYVRGDDSLNVVTGCSDPVRVAVGGYSHPFAWSPSGRFLAIQTSNAGTTFPLVIYDTSNERIITTNFVAEYPPDASNGQVIRLFLGWVDDTTFLAVLAPVAFNNPDGPFGTSTIVKVDVASQAETKVGSIAWFAATKVIAPGYLFYAGYQTKSEGQAYLHRLDLNNGTDTKLVPLGEYGNGGCQVSMFCNWTAPWDVTPDGVNVMYHNPPPATMPSDTNMVKDTPLIFSRLDGSISSTPFGTGLAAALSTPTFSPGGKYVVATGVTDKQVQLGDAWFRLLQIGGSVKDVQGAFITFRSDNQAMVIYTGSSPQPALYDIANGTTSALEQGSGSYLWAF
jgi:putative zinc finger protein